MSTDKPFTDKERLVVFYNDPFAKEELVISSGKMSFPAWIVQQGLLITNQMPLNAYKYSPLELKCAGRYPLKAVIPQDPIPAAMWNPLLLANNKLGYYNEQNSKLNLGNFERKSVAETMSDAMSQLELALHSQSKDENFQKQVVEIWKHCSRRESPPFRSPICDWSCWDLRKEFPILTGSHPIINAVVQTLLAKHLGKTRIVVATGDGQHGLAIADICARVGLQCIICMDAQDMEKQRNYVLEMQLLHAEVRAVHSGVDSKSTAIWVWVTNIETTHYILGSNAIGNRVTSYLTLDDDDLTEPCSISARTDYVRCRRCDLNVIRQHEEYHNQLRHPSVGANLVRGIAALTSNFATLSRKMERLTDNISKSSTWLAANFEKSDNLFATLGSVGGCVYRTGLPQTCEKWKNNTGNLASVSEAVSKVGHVLSGAADEAARLANKAAMAIIPARVAAVRAAAARLDAAGTAAASAAITNDSCAPGVSGCP